MTSTAVSISRPSFTWRVFVPGLVASLVLGMWQMVVEAIVGAGLWSPPIYIAATLLRGLQGAGSPASFIGGRGLLDGPHDELRHLRTDLRLSDWAPPVTAGRQVVGGSVYGIAIFIAMWFIVLPWSIRSCSTSIRVFRAT
jgi:hypothetical protein